MEIAGLSFSTPKSGRNNDVVVWRVLLKIILIFNFLPL